MVCQRRRRRRLTAGTHEAWCLDVQERFSKWTDLATGINPFVPWQPRIPKSAAVQWVRGAAGGALAACFRIPALFLLWHLLRASVWFSSMVRARTVVLFWWNAGVDAGLAWQLASVSGHVARLWRTTVERLLCAAMLPCLSIVGVSTVMLDRLAVPLRPSTSRHARGPVELSAGEVLVVTHTSFVDLLILNAAYAPSFLQTAMDGTAQRVSIIEALEAAVQAPRASLASPSPGSSAPPADDQRIAAQLRAIAADPAGGPACLLLEGGARTNGRSVLLPCAAVSDLALVHGRSARVSTADTTGVGAGTSTAAPRVRYAAIVYPQPPESAVVSPTHTSEGWWDKVWQLAANPYGTATIVRLEPEVEPQLDEASPAISGIVPAGTSSSSSSSSSWPLTAQAVLVYLLRDPRARPVKLGASDFVAFLDYARTPSVGARAADEPTGTPIVPPTPPASTSDDSSVRKRGAGRR